MAKAKLQLRDDEYLIIEVHKKGHVSIQLYRKIYRAWHAMQPIVMTARKGQQLAGWLLPAADKSSDRAFDPVVTAAKRREARQRR
jgi:hypothetical protein